MIDTRVSALGPRIAAIAARRQEVAEASKAVAARLGHVRLSTPATSQPAAGPEQAPQ